MKTIASVLAAAAIFAASSGAAVRAQMPHAHVLSTPAEAQWGPAPPLVPPGAQIAVLSGDPMKPVAYTVRFKFPAGYAIPAHSHPTDENVVIVSGGLTFGMCNKLVKGAAVNKTLKAGGYALMPANMNHFAYTGSEETTVLLYGLGPVDFKYVDPNDDPRNAKSTR